MAQYMVTNKTPEELARLRAQTQQTAATSSAASSAVSAGTVYKGQIRRRMHKARVWQDWITVSAADAAARITQDSGLWLDLLNQLAVKVKLELVYVDATTTEIQFETSNSPDGPWTTLTSAAEFNTASTYILTFSSESSDEMYPLRRYLRWTATGSAGDWSACFYLTYEPLAIR